LAGGSFTDPADAYRAPGQRVCVCVCVFVCGDSMAQMWKGVQTEKKQHYIFKEAEQERKRNVKGEERRGRNNVSLCLTHKDRGRERERERERERTERERFTDSFRCRMTLCLSFR